MLKTEQSTDEIKRRRTGIYSGLLASFLLGWAPILGKLAYRAGVDSITLAALRTVVAALLLLTGYLIFWRKQLLIKWPALLGCLLVGSINGIGSIFYYNGLVRLDAAPASLLSTLYAVWVVIFLAASGQKITRLTLLRLGVSLVGAFFVTAPWGAANPADYLGIMLMIASAAINGWYIVMGQWVLSDVPAGSATLYIITGMALTVSLAWGINTGGELPIISRSGWLTIVALGCTTVAARLAMFFSMERLGGVQTVILNLMEMVISLALAMLLLRETLSGLQWIGALLMLVSVFLARYDMRRGGAPPPAFNPMSERGSE
ncbi:MAG TPA: DMT family transporter [Thermoflexia bacterium]|nr:DMT family transporter [Thermoflexia bacterium]